MMPKGNPLFRNPPRQARKQRLASGADFHKTSTKLAQGAPVLDSARGVFYFKENLNGFIQ